MSRRRRDGSEATGCSFLPIDVLQDLFVAVPEFRPDCEVRAADLIELDQQTLAVLRSSHRVDLRLHRRLVVTPRHDRADGVLRASVIRRTGTKPEHCTPPSERPTWPLHSRGR